MLRQPFEGYVCQGGDDYFDDMLTRVETIDGSAVEGEDYEAVNEILTFEPNVTEKEVRIAFYVKNLIFHFGLYVLNYYRQTNAFCWMILLLQ